MADAANTSHRLLENLAIPFVTMATPISDTPHIPTGFNILTSVRQVIERRPGFSQAIEPTITTLGGRIERIFGWRRWNGNNFIMLATVTQSTSRVLKLEIGVDQSFIQLVEVDGTAPFDFWTQGNALYFGNGASAADGTPYNYKWIGTGIIKSWGIAGPAVKPVTNVVDLPAGVNGIDCETDYHYRYTYWDASDAHESSPSDVNDCGSQFTNKALAVSVFASPNARVSHIRIYRTRDGGSTDPAQMQEISQSPIANVDATVTDYTADADLRNSFAPGLTINDPPPAWNGFVGAGSRIYGRVGNQVWYTGFDEIAAGHGVQEECVKSGQSGNVYPFNDQIGCLCMMAGQNAGCATFMPSSIYLITGDLRSDMSRFPVEQLYGARGATNAASFGSDLAWYDISGQVRSAQIGELSADIRNLISQLDPIWTQVSTHVSGARKWLCVLDSLSGTLYVYDIDLHIWQTPWPCGATAVASCEISPGKRALFAAINGQVVYMVDGIYNDVGKPYPAELRTSLIPVVSEDNPDVPIEVESLSIERSNVSDVSDILVSHDELPDNTGAYVSIKVNEGDPTNRQPSQSLIEKRYTVEQDWGIARRVSIYLKWAAVDSNFELYSVNVEEAPFV